MSEPIRMRRIAELDALRGMAAMVVLWHHVFTVFHASFDPLREAAPLLHRVGEAISSQNTNAVMLFFVLSGFSIRLAIHGQPITMAAGLMAYTWRRALRILPLYWLSLLFTALAALIHAKTDESFSTWNLLGNLAFLQSPAASKGNWFLPFGMNGPYWSLSFEVFYYALLPALLLLLRPGTGWWAEWPGTVLLASLMASVAAVGLNAVLPNPFFTFLIGWHIWMAGFVLAHCYLHGRTAAIFAGPLLFAVAGQLGFFALARSSVTFELLFAGVYIVSLGAVITLHRQQIPRRLLEPARAALRLGFERIGRGSYALYLLHYPLLLAIAASCARFEQPDGSLPPHALVPIAVSLLTFATILCPYAEVVITRATRRMLAGARQPNRPVQEVASAS